MSKARVFVPLTKVDQAQRLVYGVITQQLLDKSGEMMDYATSKPNFEKWSEEFQKATDGNSFGNLRVMHGPTVAGKLTDMSFDDESQSIEVCAKVVDDAEWAKVEEGCYTGFSVGGKYVKRWTDTVDGKVVKMYTAQPHEVSLVDNPCLSTARFSLVKADGETAEVDFRLWEPTNAEVAAKATDLAKAAGFAEGAWADFMDEAREALKKERGFGDEEEDEKEADAEAKDEDAEDEEAKKKKKGMKKFSLDDVSQKWTTPDGKTFDKKADAIAHLETLEKAEDVPEPTEAELLQAKIDELKKAVETVKAGPEGDEDEEDEVSAFDNLEKLHSVIEAIRNPTDDVPLQKDMWQVSRLADVLGTMCSIQRSMRCEADREKDESKVPDELKAVIEAALAVFLASAQEEATELVASLSSDKVEYYYNSADKDDADPLAKDVAAVIRSCKGNDEVFQKFVTAHADRTTPAPVEDDRLAKVVSENEELKKMMAEVTPQLEDLVKQVQQLRDTPMPSAPRTTVVVDKTEDTGFKKADGTVVTVDSLKKMVDELGHEAVSLELIKIAQQRPGKLR
jgi:hypothetical protein